MKRSMIYGFLPRVMGVLIMFGLIALAIGCSPSATPVGPGTTEPGAKKEGPPKSGGTFQYLARLAPGNLNMYSPAAGYGMTSPIGPNLYERLISLDYSSNDIDYRAVDTLVPRLAERWDISPDGKAFTFYLRKGVKWHDGQPFGAKDVVFSVNYAMDPKLGSPVRALYRFVDKVEQVDDYTVRLTLGQVDVDFLKNLAAGTSQILPKHVLDRGDKFEQVAIGTGPFKLESHDPTKATVVVKNKDYWEPGKPYIDRIVIFQGMDRSAEIAAFTTKQFDVIHPGDKAILQSLLPTNKDMQYGTVLQDLGPILVPRQDVPPFNDVRVRRAVQLAIDRHGLNQVGSFGDGLINPPGLWGKMAWAIPQADLLKLPGFRKEKEQDIAEAKRLMAEAGYPNGFTTSLIYPQTFSTAPKIAEIGAQNLKQIGITMALKPMEDAAWAKADAEGSYEVDYQTGNNTKPSTMWRNLLYSKGVKNKIGINDPDLDAIIDAEAKELDQAKRKDMWLKLQRILLDKVYMWPSIDFANYAAWQPWVHGYRYSISANVSLLEPQSVWLDVEKMPADRRR